MTRLRGKDPAYQLLGCLGLCLFTYQGARELMAVVLPSLQGEFRLSFTQLGLIAGSYDLGYATTLIAGGMLADRYGKARMIRWGLLAFSLLTLLTTLVSRAQQIMALRFFSAFGFSVYFGAANAFIAQRFDPSQIGRAIGFHFSGGAAGRLVLPFVAGLITARLGWRYAFLVLTLSGLTSWFSFVLVTRRQPKQSDPHSSALTLRQLLQRVIGNRRLVHLSLIFFVVILSSTVTVLIPTYLVLTWGISLVVAASYLLITFAATIASSPMMGAFADRWGWRPVSVVAMGLNTLLLALFPRTAPGLLLLLILAGLGFSSRVITVLVSQASTLSPPQWRASALGFFNTAGTIAVTLVPILGGYVADLVNLSASFYLFSALSLMGMVVISVAGPTTDQPKPATYPLE